MQEEMENNVNQAIEWLQKTGAAVQDFAVEQAPLYCREIVALEAAKGLALCGCAAVAMIIAFVLWRKSLELKKGRNRDFDDSGDGTFAIACAAGFIGLAMMAIGSVTTIRAKIAPRVVIVEHLRNL